MDTKVFLPDSLLRCDGCYLRGHSVSRGTELAIFITAHSTELHKLTTGLQNSPGCLYGRFGASGSVPRQFTQNTIEVDARDGLLNVSRLVIDHNPIHLRERNVVIVFYEYDTIRSAENWPSIDQTFSELYSYVRAERGLYLDAPEGPTRRSREDKEMGVEQWLSTLVFCVQLKNFYEIMSWSFWNIKRNKRISIKMGNMIAALLVDILIGCIILKLVNVRSIFFSEIVMEYIETVVNYLRSLLKWLMGAPAGLKLNNAFNNMLGKFFLYHIDLWWMFLELTKGGLNIVSQLYYYFGFLGVTFQAAIISDMISFISFHAYCIYVYVARLFNLQVSGLAALLRLFVGRKRNPLRGGVDSCEYSNQELFAGTVAFTVLLFLLPTTAMYYTVFTLFRLLSLAVQGTLARLCYTVKTLPLYVTFLWLVRSPRIAGNIHIDVLKEQGGTLPLILEVKFTALPLRTLVNLYRPSPLRSLGPMQWTGLLSKVLKGNLISSNRDMLF